MFGILKIQYGNVSQKWNFHPPPNSVFYVLVQGCLIQLECKASLQARSGAWGWTTGWIWSVGLCTWLESGSCNINYCSCRSHHSTRCQISIPMGSPTSQMMWFCTVDLTCWAPHRWRHLVVNPAAAALSALTPGAVVINAASVHFAVKFLDPQAG